MYYVCRVLNHLVTVMCKFHYICTIVQISAEDLAEEAPEAADTLSRKVEKMASRVESQLPKVCVPCAPQATTRHVALHVNVQL